MTKLEWSTTLCDGKYVDFTAAEKAAEALGEGWRLPTIHELFTLVDHSREAPAVDTTAFPDTKKNWYWSSTSTAWNSSAVWIVHFHLGFVDDGRRDGGACVRAVRSSQEVPDGEQHF